jgi:hypothetical protein
MIGIYQDSFVDYLKNKLGASNIKTSSKNIIAPCPWCEYNEDKKHYHLYISLDAPIFHCFHASCEKSGNIKKLLRFMEGHDISDKFVDKEALNEASKKQHVFKDNEVVQKRIILPPLNKNQFYHKEFYIKKRLKFADISSSSIYGLIYDVNTFIEKNKIPVDETLFRLRDYLQANFVGFLTENKSTVMFRNTDHSHSMKFFKLKIQQSNFLDYYKLKGNGINSKKIVLAEGIFDIFTEQIYDSLNIKNGVELYASALSSKYISLIHSIVFHEQIFQPDVIILSDRGIELDYYRKMKKYNRHIIKSLTVYYNKTGKDFNVTPVTPVLIDI